MDDAVRPQDGPDKDGGPDPGSADDGTAREAEPVAEYAPEPREEAVPRLDLDRDPFAPSPAAYPVLDPEALIPASEAATDAAGEPSADEDGAPSAADALGEPSASDCPEQSPGDTAEADAPAPQAKESEAPALETDAVTGSQEALSLDDMVGELANGEPATAEECAAESGEQDAGVEGVEEAVEAGESEEAPEPEPESWRDAAASESEAVTAPVLARRHLSTRLPFWIYGGLWAVFVGVLTYLMWPLSEKPFVESSYYMYFVLGGAGMAVVGLVLGVVTWAVGRAGTARADREGLVRAVMLRTMGWTAIGVVLWWACLYALDLHRTGVIG